ncbi:MAG: hypothetical protein ACSLEY_04065 [Candidatus Saccharimonadales bacterium]
MREQKQLGVVSLFIVVFACLAVTIVTVSFVSIMIRGQQQAIDTDLANSAYDSAIAGVEDAKRLALLYRGCKNSGTLDTTCQSVLNAVENQDCNSIQTGLGIGSAEEVLVRSSLSDTAAEQLDQAYTCVKINYYPKDFIRELQQNTTQLVELKGIDPYNSVRISWHLRTDSTISMTGIAAPLSVADEDLPASSGNNWPATTPAILRAQFIQTKSDDFTLADFNDTTDSGRNSAATFLYPSVVATANLWPTPVSLLTADPALSTNPTIPKEPTTVNCRQDIYNDGSYACSALIELPDPRGGGLRANSYLALSSFYNDTDYKIELIDTLSPGDYLNQPISFDGVQPAVDSTGRANDLFRRVDARIEFTPDLAYPNAALDLSDTLCKAFALTDNRADFQPGTCTP